MVRLSQLRTVWLGLSTSIWYPLHRWSPTVGALWVVLNYFFVKYWYELWILLATLPRDLGAGIQAFKGKRHLSASIQRRATVAKLFTETAEKYPNKTMIASAESTWTFKEARRFSNQVATHFRARGLKAGDEVALLMENRPEFVLIWLGLSKIGVITALVNYNLKAKSLAHCINAVKTRAVIFSNSLAPALDSSEEFVVDRSIEYYHMERGESPLTTISSKSFLESVAVADDAEEIYSGDPKDRLLYIFTSGTTGMPKAAIVTNQRFMFCAANMFYTNGFRVEDNIYLSLPLYHNSGGTLGPGTAMIYGTSCYVSKKFSASKFWPECKQYKCTIALYIGEMFRYLLAQPARDTDSTHGVRMLFGHGARKQLWQEFRNRFKVENIREIYGSTEGNAGLINTDNTPGAIGFLPTVCRLNRFVASLILPMHIIRVDPETGKPVRDRHGFCVQCQPNEPGEIIGMITTLPFMRFEGYVDRSATQKKIYDNIFTSGDQAFATSDIAYYDDYGYVFFQDRTGDTFRWKSENVSTNEVESVIATILGLRDAIVYGVEVEGTEGKAGMVSILDDGEAIDLQRLLREMDNQLPAYAVPIFLRFKKEIESTSTLKYKKVTLVEEGFNPAKCSKDPLFFLDRKSGSYVPLTVTLYDDIVAGKVRL